MNLVWREARMADADLLWRWANDRETRANSFTSSPIPYEEHVSWLAQRLGSDTTRIWIFSDGDAPVGQVRIDISGAIAEIGITVAPEHRRSEERRVGKECRCRRCGCCVNMKAGITTGARESV